MNKERIKDKLEVSALIGIFLLSILAITPAHADEIKFGFKNPSFSGIGTGAHYLTIENQEFSRKKQIEDALEAARKAAEREADNTTLAKFIRNLNNALIRIENNTYGICRVTGKLISKERLRLVPHATLSIEAKKAQ